MEEGRATELPVCSVGASLVRGCHLVSVLGCFKAVARQEYLSTVKSLPQVVYILCTLCVHFVY